MTGFKEVSKWTVFEVTAEYTYRNLLKEDAVGKTGYGSASESIAKCSFSDTTAMSLNV